jgi:tripartite-type tricarboxylate transporter receptor subunit TctC
VKFISSPFCRLNPCAILLAACGPAGAQDRAASFPSKTVRLITGSAPGGPLDFSARLAAQKLSEAFGQPVVVEPRLGASGTIANEFTAKAAPDGHTLGLGSMATLCVVPHLYAKLGYDPQKDFAPITIVSAVGFVVIVHPAVPARTLKELIALGKASPGKLSFGTSGAGSVTHLGIEMLKSMAGVNFLHIPYKGAAPAMVDLIGGQTDLMYDSVLTSTPHIKSGRVRALAVGSAKRTPLLPDVPTAAESGLPGFEASTWFGIVAPAATPRDIVMKLNAAIVKGVSDKEVVQRLLGQGMDTVLNTPEQFTERIKADLPRWGKIIKAAGIKAD